MQHSKDSQELLDAIGNTPLIRLRGPSEATGCDIYGKAEFMNPGGSVKDRAALAIIEDAEERGDLRPGGMIVEGTAGNTGIGLTMVGNAKGYTSVIVMPETQSQEKKDVLRIFGADLRLVPAKPYKDPGNYVRYSERLAAELAATHEAGVIWANQFDNTANLRGHYRTTGPEIWEQTGGGIHGFTCAVGSGGTIAGVGKYLKEQKKDVRIALSDPWRAEGGRQFDFRRHRPGADHRQSCGGADRHSLPPFRCRGASDHLRPDARRGLVSRWIDGYQHRGRDGNGPRYGTGPYHCHHPV